MENRSFSSCLHADALYDALEYVGGRAFCEGSLRLRGGGGDGGSTGAESRSSYLEMYKTKKDVKVDPAQARHAHWTRCAYSGEPFREPIVADEGGNLFNKAELLEGLAGKALGKPWPESLEHIRLKELIPVRPRWSADYSGATDEAGTRPGTAAPFECPIAEVPLNGRGRTVLHRATGALVSEKGLEASPALVRAHFAECAAQRLEAEAAAARGALGDALRRVGESGGVWEEGDLLLINPEGPEMEAARDRVRFLREKRATKRGNGKKGGSGGKRPALEYIVPDAKRAKGGVLNGLFHEDGGGARIAETFCCRSIGARGLNLS